MDKLESIFALQAKLDADIRLKHSLDAVSPDEWVQKKALALIAEVGEVLSETNYRWWKKPREIDRDALYEELADILHFYIGMCIDAGLSADKLYEVYTQKNQENHLRQEGLSQKDGYI